jgi:ABC-type branched-subunit amino acid transport system substrate-binding protein
MTMISQSVVALFYASAIFVVAFSGKALAEDGVTKDHIFFGQVAALAGPAEALGRGMREGILAAFGEANGGGGVNGRRLELKSVDDGYEPERTIEATKKIVNDKNVLGLIGV